MHDYEVIKYAGVAIFGLSLGIFLDGPIATLISVVLIAFGVTKAGFYYSLHKHTDQQSYRINRLH